MEILVSYDVATESEGGPKRLRKVAQACKDYGQRVQKSVFECSVNDVQYERLKQRLLECIDEKEDSLRIYKLREPRTKYVETFGIDPRIDFNDPLVL
ncbi:MAG TPA: CRISPR-associated endonuclease Cas2 [Firmicutes bacterium]|nr:CRISPR-associated endonuclease Cas2 [Bacillota bacterium]